MCKQDAAYKFLFVFFLCTDTLAPVPRDEIRRHQSCHGECWGAGGAGESPGQYPGLWRRPMRQRLPAGYFLPTFPTVSLTLHHFTGQSPDFSWSSISESTENIFIWQMKQYFDNELYITVTQPLCFKNIRHLALCGMTLIIVALINCLNCLPQVFISVCNILNGG